MAESSYERRQREAAQRILKAAMPDVQRLLGDVLKQQSYMADIGKIFSEQHRNMVASIVANIPKIEFSQLDIPVLKLDYKTLFPDFAAIQADAVKALLPSIQLIQDVQREQFARIIAQARAGVLASLPPNWRADDIGIPGDLEALLLDEGLPLAWVPPSAVVAKLFAADSSAARRKIIGGRWRTIAAACVEELDAIENADLAEHIGFAKKSATILLSGQHEGSQALSANLLDSILRAEFSNDDRLKITGQRSRLDIDDYPLRVAIVLGGIWGSHGEYWPDKGDKIPRAYSRHGSAHGVSRRQYSRINSVLALMHVTALLRMVDSDL